jgi:7-carboxy-7-deazaguanine synthase
MEKANIIDLHTCIQGEGKFSGVPHILVRVSGCNLKCHFKSNICDTPYSSWFPEKGHFTFQDVEYLYVQNPQINHTFITGGEPFLDVSTTRQLIRIAKKHNHFVAAETNGSLWADLDFDFVTISPKLSNSIPVEGNEIMNTGGETYRITNHDALKHDRQRINLKVLEQLVKRYDYQMKFVVQDEKDIKEITELTAQLQVPNEKTYLMPEGITPEGLQQRRAWTIEKCIEMGVNYSDRLHIVAYGNQREA